ncbi:hypothetical protein PR048_031415 [Dryococelus australis]|uniref:Uncharacterized protein n=1 Tax=Dryococelus australis TaxID=614101 RepID=A0ABQ9G824_9NEOP|nr:hypothetical protein PR048_031415 [Dryococelus australis]
MAGETKDVSKGEQLAILIRYVDCEDFKIKERAIGLHNFSKILKNFEAILIVLDEGMKDRAGSIGIRAQMEQQCFIFLLYAMELVLGITYSLSLQLQSKDIDFTAAGCLIKSTKEELARIRSSEKYDELVKNYLWSICSDDRLSSLMILSVEQEGVKKIPLDELVNDFARMKERRYPLLH